MFNDPPYKYFNTAGFYNNTNPQTTNNNTVVTGHTNDPYKYFDANQFGLDNKRYWNRRNSHQMYTKTFGDPKEFEFDKSILDSIPEPDTGVNANTVTGNTNANTGTGNTNANTVTGNTNANTGTGNGAVAKDRNYTRNVFYNGAKSMLRHLPTTDSIQQYIEAKRDTPDYSAINAAKHYAMRPTHVLRQSPSHISSNIKFNPYDYTNEANQINALAANGINNIRKRGSGNLNALIGNVANLLAQARQSAGDAARKGWKANEDGRIAVGQANNKADEFNAVADNQADANYVQSRNSAALQDKSNGINALNTYAQRKYDMDIAHKNLLRGLRDQMVGNLGEEGMTAYENNRTNTNRRRNYWTDGLGRHHYLSSQISDYEKMELAKDFLGSKEFTQWFNNNYKQNS